MATKLKALRVQRVERGKNLHAYLQTFWGVEKGRGEPWQAAGAPYSHCHSHSVCRATFATFDVRFCNYLQMQIANMQQGHVA